MVYLSKTVFIRSRVYEFPTVVAIGANNRTFDSVDGLLVGGQSNVDLELLDDALTQRASVDERAAKVVELRFFGGMQVREVAEVLNVSERTVAQDWSNAKAWLHKEMTKESSG